MINTIHVGYQYKHADDFNMTIGIGRYWMLINTLSPAEFFINEEWVVCNENQIIIFPPGIYVDYRAHKTEYKNNYILFTTDEDFIVNTPCPLGTPISVSSQLVFNYIFHMIAIDNFSKPKNAESNILLLYRLLFNKIEENYIKLKNNELNNHNSYEQDLYMLNANIAGNPKFDWTIDYMASQLNLCKGYFQKIYKKQFGFSCMEFVYHNRIELAKSYLRSSSLRIKDIYSLCGYNNPEHFSRHFKRITSMSPQEYRELYNKHK